MLGKFRQPIVGWVEERNPTNDPILKKYSFQRSFDICDDRRGDPLVALLASHHRRLFHIGYGITPSTQGWDLNQQYSLIKPMSPQ